MWELMEDKGYFINSCKLIFMQNNLGVNSLFLIRVILPSLVQDGVAFSKGNLCPAFRQIMGEQRILPASVDFQLSSAQNGPYAKMAYFGVAYSDLLYQL